MDRVIKYCHQCNSSIPIDSDGAVLGCVELSGKPRKINGESIPDWCPLPTVKQQTVTGSQKAETLTQIADEMEEYSKSYGLIGSCVPPEKLLEWARQLRLLQTLYAS